MIYNEIKSVLSNEWVVGPLACLLWVLTGLLIKKAAYLRFRRFIENSTGLWDEIIIQKTSMPLNLIILLVGLNIMKKLMPLQEKVDGNIGFAIKVTLMLIATLFVDQLVRAMLVSYDRRMQAAKLSQGLIQGIISSVIFLIGGLMVLASAGINISPMLASLGVGTLAVALALQSTLANLFSGIFITMDKSINVGDLIELENGSPGSIEDIGWRTSKVRLRNDNLLVIPNSKLVDSIVTNYEGDDKRIRGYISCGVGYDSDLRHVQRVVLDVAAKATVELEEADSDFEPSMWFDEFSDYSINFTLVVRARDFPSRFTLISDIIIRLHERFKMEGILIPFPIRTLDILPKHETILRDISKNNSSAGSARDNI